MRIALRALVVPVLFALAACSGPTGRPHAAAYGPYPDRAARDEAFRRLSPDEQRRRMHWAASNPEAVRQWNRLTPEEQEEVREMIGELPGE